MQSQIEAIRSTCSMCQNYCGLIAYRSNGRVIRLEGDPENHHSRGHLCAKGLSGFMNMYSPLRFTKPMKRTNPKKGIGVDPMWKEITWEEAIDTVSRKVKEAMDNPSAGGIANNTFDHPAMYAGVQTAWGRAVGSTPIGTGGYMCGTSVHPIVFLNMATFEHTGDYEYAKYILLLGAQAGSLIHYDTMQAAFNIAKRRPGGIKVVAVDPTATYAGSTAEEWIPIRPGTDAAFVLSLANLLLNTFGIYDEEFLKKKTNAPYLVGPDGRYARDKATNKPLMWDAVDNKAKTFDAHFGDCALTGNYEVDGIMCRPGFDLVREHLRKYTPEYAAEITTIPPETTRRIAKELGEAACIGQTVEIDGVSLPYRPVSIMWYRGISSHKNSFLTSFANMLLCVILGAVQVPGGLRGHPRYLESMSEDGLLAAKPPGSVTVRAFPYPVRETKKPRSFDAFELFPVAHEAYGIFSWVASNPERFGYKPGEYRLPQVLFTFRAENMENTVSPKKVEAVYSKIPFIVAFALESTPSVDMADVVIPELHHLERLAETVSNRADAPGLWYAARPVVSPPFEQPYDKLLNSAEIYLEFARRGGYLPAVYRNLNEQWELTGTEYELDPDKEYTYTELIDRELKRRLGPDKGIDWLLSPRGGIMSRAVSAKEAYPAPFRKARIHLYYEFLIEAGERVRKVTREMGIPWDTSDYQPIPDWRPCPSYEKRGGEFDLFITNYKVPILAHGFGRKNPLLTRLVDSHSLDVVLINPATAEAKGIKDGDEIQLETRKGYKAKSVVAVTERVHPEVVATLQHKIKKGVEFNETIAQEEEEIGFVNASVDTCTLVKISKAST